MGRLPERFPAKQRGAALLLGLLMLVMAMLTGLFWNIERFSSRTERDKITATSLARAKDALISAAASADLSSGRPGELPCPALDDDGNAASSCSTQASRIGRLPWRTLGLPNLRDGSGEVLWYALSANYRKNGPSINSDTPGTITVRDLQGSPIFDAAAGTGAVAVVIAAGPPFTRPTSVSDASPYVQTRSGAGTSLPANYLDLANGEDNGDFADGSANGFINGPIRDASGNVVSNDQVLAISRDELMAATERRVAREVKACVEQHADSSLNASHQFPWPAPLSASNYKGKAGSYFGQVPAYQPGVNLQDFVQKTLSDLSNARASVASATTASDQLTALQSLAKPTESARQFFYWLYLALKDPSFSGLSLIAVDTRSRATALDNTIDDALAVISLTTAEKNRIKNSAGSLQTDIDALQVAISDIGIDAFPPEMASKGNDFQLALSKATSSPSKSRFDSLNLKAAAVTQLLVTASTPNAAISASLTTALSASQQAGAYAALAAAAPTDAMITNAALASGDALVSAINALQSTIATNRVNLGATVIDGHLAGITAAAAQFSANPSAELAGQLATRESELQKLVDNITTGSPAIIASRNSASAALGAAVTSISSGDYAQAVTAAAAAAAATQTLSSAIQNNGDNLAQTSMAAAANAYATARAAYVSASNQGTATTLQNVGLLIYYWADIIARQANNVALLVYESTSPVSAFDVTGNLSTSITGSSGSATALEAYIASPDDSQLQTQASARLATTINRLDTLISSVDGLQGSLTSSAGNAYPMVWQSPAGHCDFLNHTNESSWWNANGWSAYIFYQIGNIDGTAAGSLKVNGTGTYRVVAIAAGRALSGQNRATRTTANYLEDINTDPTRDGDASSPVQTFVDRVFSANLNDRLAY